MDFEEKLVKLKKYFFKIISSKIDVTNIIVGHLNTLKNYRDDSRLKDLLTFFAVPFVTTLILLFISEGRLNSPTAEAILIALTIFTPITFSLLVSVFSIDEKLLMKKRNLIVVKEFKNNISFIIILCLVSIFVIILKSLLGGNYFLVLVCLNFIIIYLLLIVGLTILQILKRWNFIIEKKLDELEE